MGKTIRFAENSLIAIKKRLNEIMVGTDGVSHNDVVTLWHGTDIPGMLGILKSNSICAKDGVQHGETYGINWFSLKKVDNFCKGVVFSIDVPSIDFKSKFKMMNSAEATAKDDRIDISQYNLKIEKFCDFGREQLNRYYDILVERGEHFPVETIRDNIFYEWCEKSGNEDVYMSVRDQDFGLIMANILGEEVVRKEGFLSEEVAKEFAPVTSVGMEKGGGPGLNCHMSQKKESPEEVNEAYNVSVRGDIDNINVVEFIPHEDAREEGYEDDEIEDFEPYYEIEAKDIDGETVLYADLTAEELSEYFSEDVVEDIINKNARLSNSSRNEYRIDDILYRDTTPSNIDDVEEVNRIAKKLSTGGPSSYILVDGSVISFQDHIYITNIDGMTPDKFIALGNIRVTCGGGIELIKEPTFSQYSELRDWIRHYGGDEIYLDVGEPSNKTYPEPLFSVKYVNANPNRIINDIVYYFQDGIRPEDVYEGKKEDKHVLDESREDSLQLAIKFRPDKYNRWAVIFPSRPGLMPQFFEKIRLAKEFKSWYRDDCEIVDLDKQITENTIISEDRYDELFSFWNLNKNIPDYDEAISYFKNIKSQLSKEMDDICNKYGCKRMFFIASINQGHLQVDPNDLERFKELGDKRLETNKKIENLEARKESIIQDIEREKESAKRRELERKEQEENDKLFSLAIEEYGLSDIGNAGYILPDGELLNFGRSYGDTDHRNIAWIYQNNNIEIWDNSYRSNYITDFMNRGAIRCDVNVGLLDMAKEPTKEQYSVINTFVRYIPDDVNLNIDFSDNLGNPEHSVSYSNHNPQRVVSDIYKYYNEGLKPLGESKSKKVIIPEERLIAIMENMEKEVESSEVDLSSFKKRDTLPPGIWKDEETLNSKVRLKLLDIADDFWKFVNLTWVEPKGIIITGSICNFNWSKFSDIDLHLVVDFNEIDSKTEFVKQYLDSKKNEWNSEHSDLKIMGYPVELYTQDIKDDVEAGGIYDLEENAWIRRPNPHTIKNIGLEKFGIKNKAAEIMTIIDEMYKALSSTDDGYEVSKIGEDAHYLWDKVKDLRKKSLTKRGENGAGNIVYKVLRRTGYLDKLFKLFSATYDKSNSITESTKQYLKVLKEEFAMDGSTEGNPYQERWKAERDALKNFIANYGKLMQSKEDNKEGRIYKVYYDKSLSELIGYNYCVCVQWDEMKLKPKSTVYIRALDKFTPFIRRNIQFDARGRDNVFGNYDDIRP